MNREEIEALIGRQSFHFWRGTIAPTASPCTVCGKPSAGMVVGSPDVYFCGACLPAKLSIQYALRDL